MKSPEKAPSLSQRTCFDCGLGLSLDLRHCDGARFGGRVWKLRLYQLGSATMILDPERSICQYSNQRPSGETDNSE